MKEMFWKWVQRVTKKADIKNELPEEIVKRGVEIALHNHVMNYPHSYFGYLTLSVVLDNHTTSL